MTLGHVIVILILWILLPCFRQQNSFLPDTCFHNFSAKDKADNYDHKKNCQCSGNEDIASFFECCDIRVHNFTSMEVKVVKFYINYNTKIAQKLAYVNNYYGYAVLSAYKPQS